jgi:hypothetical protein
MFNLINPFLATKKNHLHVQGFELFPTTHQTRGKPTATSIFPFSIFAKQHEFGRSVFRNKTYIFLSTFPNK